jgi:DNA-binding MarR family transcriptional regulator
MPGPAVHASTLVLRLARELRTALDQAFGPWQLTSQQAGLLVHVYAGQDSPTELARLLGTDGAGMTRMIDRLESKGLLRRGDHPDDRRAKVVALTDAGRELVPDLPAVFDAVAARLVGDQPAAQVLDLLDTLLANLADPAR